MLTTAPKVQRHHACRCCAWRYLEDTMRKVCAQYGYKEIRTPVFEHRAVPAWHGETTDVVENECTFRPW